jgi:hypothetical protein
LGYRDFLRGHVFFIELEIVGQVDHPEAQHGVVQGAGLGDFFLESGVLFAGC